MMYSFTGKAKWPFQDTYGVLLPSSQLTATKKRVEHFNFKKLHYLRTDIHLLRKVAQWSRKTICKLEIYNIFCRIFILLININIFDITFPYLTFLKNVSIFYKLGKPKVVPCPRVTCNRVLNGIRINTRLYSQQLISY